MKHPRSLAALALPLLLATCASPSDGNAGDPLLQAEAQTFLDAYQPIFQELTAIAEEADWASNTRIVAGDESNARRTEMTRKAQADFMGSVENIEAARRLLARADALTDLQVRQLESILYMAAAKPGTVPELVEALIAARTAQVEKLYGFSYVLDGEEVSTNELDAILKEELNLDDRLAAWEVSKEVGPGLRPGLIELQRLRNANVRALGYDDFFSYKASNYGMTLAEMQETVERVNRELRPLYRELHTWARYALAERYGVPVPDLIPAHWLPNRWGQDWGALVEVEGMDLDAALAERGSEWLVRQAERFYISLGFEPLPESFYELSSLYPLPADADYKKNNHASAWHMDLDEDVRSLMSVEPNQRWYETTHHELGHIYYYLCYSNPDVPLVLREGANRAYHEGIGSLMGLAAMQPRFVEAIGLSDGSQRPDPMQLLLKEALNYVVFIPWSTGTMFDFEKELYADELPPEQWNQRWWELARRHQGIVSPAPRGEAFCDAATKTHINNDPAEYYDYALSFVLLFQFHDHIAKKILREDVHDTNYFGRKDVGSYLQSILRPGASVDWREMLREKTGGDLSAQAMLDYFEPLMGWLQEQNRGREATLPPL